MTDITTSENIVDAREDFQMQVDEWMDACFGAAIKLDQLERADRFVEEALELVQTMPRFTAERAHALVDYVFGRPVGERYQEVGGVMVTLAALCNTVEISMLMAASRELARIWTKVDQIRAKQAAKPTGSALPIATPAESEHPNAADWRNRAERAEAECAELRSEASLARAAFAALGDGEKALLKSILTLDDALALIEENWERQEFGLRTASDIARDARRKFRGLEPIKVQPEQEGQGE